MKFSQKKPQRHLNLRSFIRALASCGELHEISAPVDPNLELSEIHRRVVQAGGPALLFKNVQTSAFPVVTNLFGSKKRLQIALGEDINERLDHLLHLMKSGIEVSLKSLWTHRKSIRSLISMGTKTVRNAPLLSNITKPDLTKIPFIRCWPDDGGAFLTLPLVYTEHPELSTPNLGMYRMQRFSQDDAGLHWQIGRGGACHYYTAEKKNCPLPVTVYLGGPPALILSAIAPLPENVSELLLASFLMHTKLDQVVIPTSCHRLISECDLALIGHAAPHLRRLEGPFGDHSGYQDPTSNFPVFHCTKMLYRNDAIIPATVVGKPLQEDSYIGNFLQELMLPFIKLMIPNVTDLYTYPETGFHPLCSVCVEERYEKESLATAFRLLGEGQLSLTKVLFVVKEGVLLQDIKAVLFHLLTHLRCEDIYLIPNTSTDTLDPSAPYRNKGSKIIFLGTASKPRRLPTTPPKQCSLIKTSIVFTPGCLVIDGPKYEDLTNPGVLTTFPELKEWPLVILVDDAVECCSSNTAFLWNAFTRFNPSTNIHSSQHAGTFSFPVLIDARIKPSYQKALEVDPETKIQVDTRFNEYFT